MRILVVGPFCARASWALQLAVTADIALGAIKGIVAPRLLSESMAYLVLVPLPVGRALLTSLAANAVSAGLGLALHALDVA